jgi:DNA-binding LacI/PurR family transcriptional regulator
MIKTNVRLNVRMSVFFPQQAGEILIMSKAITLKQVAKHAGVSYQTVSKVLNKQAQVSKETEARILDAVRILEYRPNSMARNMRQGRTRMIGYSWMPTPDDQFNPILDRFLQSMAQEAESSNYHVVLFPHRSGQELLDLYDELIGTRQVDAFVISNVEFHDKRILHLQKRKFPFIAFGRSSPELDFPYIDVDGGKGMYDLVCYLAEKGHKRIALLAWPEDSRVGQNRMDGVLAGLHDSGIELMPGLLLRGEGSAQFGRQAAGRLLDLPERQRPTAIIGLNDFMAIGAMQVAQERGLRVGGDIAIAGFDDNPISQYLNPTLTSVRQPIAEVGKMIISVLINLLEKEDPEQIPVYKRQVLLSPELVVRAST